MISLSIFELIGYAIIFIVCFLFFIGALTALCNTVIDLLKDKDNAILL